MEQIKLRLKELRIEKKKKQIDIANFLSVSKSLYCRYEKGERSVSLEILWKLADYYEVTIDYLVGRADY